MRMNPRLQHHRQNSRCGCVRTQGGQEFLSADVFAHLQRHLAVTAYLHIKSQQQMVDQHTLQPAAHTADQVTAKQVIALPLEAAARPIVACVICHDGKDPAHHQATGAIQRLLQYSDPTLAHDSPFVSAPGQTRTRSATTQHCAQPRLETSCQSSENLAGATAQPARLPATGQAHSGQQLKLCRAVSPPPARTLIFCSAFWPLQSRSAPCLASPTARL